MSVLSVSHLTKKFGSFCAVDDISFDLKEGEILGLLGRNGAGKTTTIQMLLGVLTPTSGGISCFGLDMERNREKILEQMNFSSTYTNLPWRLTVKENLTFISYLYDISDRKSRLLKIRESFRLEDLWNSSMSDLSSGQITRINLAKAFINYPKILLLDEPTASLDPETADYFRTFLLEERKKYNVSIIWTSHNMAEVEEVCDRVLFIDAGAIVADGTPDALAKTIEISHVELNVEDGLKRTIEYCINHKLTHKLTGRYIIIDIKENEIPKLLKGIMEVGVSYTEISIEKPTLEDFFLYRSKNI